MAMDTKKSRDHLVAGSSGRMVNNASCPFGSSHAFSNGLTNGIYPDDEPVTATVCSNHAILRTALSCEENDGVTSVDDGERNNMESGACPKYKSCRERLCRGTLDLDAPSSSGANSVSVCEEPSMGGEARRNRKRTADCHTGRSNLKADGSSSDTSNDDHSVGSEDGCIYTYRGGEHLADLPSSFFSLDMGLPVDRVLWTPPPRPLEAQREEQRNSGASSPDMDYLEMDFDPGPSCEADSEETSPDEDLEASSSTESPEIPVSGRGTTPDTALMPQEPIVEIIPVVPSPDRSQAQEMECQPSTSTGGVTTRSSLMPGPSTMSSSPPAVSCMQAGSLVPHVNARGERLMVRRTCRRWPPRAPVTHHANSGDLVCERGGGEASNTCITDTSPTVDRINLSSALYHCTMAKKLMVEKPNADFMEGADTSNVTDDDVEFCDGDAGSVRVCEVPRCMIWSEREACERQVTQIATSACGATAVINAFLALGIPIDMDKINHAVGTRQRANNAPIPRYLLSRSVAGCTAAGLVAGLQQASGSLVTARFFPTHPERAVSLSHWLADWISLGAVPILTLNLQAGHEGDTDIPDAWHHQMVFGVSPRGVYLTNPVECVAESQLWPQLCSESVLLVRSRDVLSRLTPATDLTPLMCVPDVRWATSNVLGQVVNVMREARESERAGGEASARSRHVRVPCAYRPGVTVAALTGSEAHRRLTRAHHLPLYAQSI